MKRIGMVALVLLACGLVAFSEMDNKTFGAGQTIGVWTNTYTLALRGELEGFYINVGTATTRTQTVTVASEQQTIFSKAVSADAWYPVRYGTFYRANGAAIVGNTTTTNLPWGKVPLAGPITCTVVGGNATSKTNTTVVTVVYDRD